MRGDQAAASVLMILRGCSSRSTLQCAIMAVGPFRPEGVAAGGRTTARLTGCKNWTTGTADDGKDAERLHWMTTSGKIDF